MFVCIFFLKDASLSVVGKDSKRLKLLGELMPKEPAEMKWGKDTFEGTIIKVHESESYLDAFATAANKKILSKLPEKPQTVPAELFSFDHEEKTGTKRERKQTSKIKESIQQEECLVTKKAKKVKPKTAAVTQKKCEEATSASASSDILTELESQFPVEESCSSPGRTEPHDHSTAADFLVNSPDNSTSLSSTWRLVQGLNAEDLRSPSSSRSHPGEFTEGKLSAPPKQILDIFEMFLEEGVQNWMKKCVAHFRSSRCSHTIPNETCFEPSVTSPWQSFWNEDHYLQGLTRNQRYTCNTPPPTCTEPTPTCSFALGTAPSPPPLPHMSRPPPRMNNPPPMNSPPQPMNNPPQPMNNPPQPMNNPPPPPHMSRPPPRMNNPPPPPMNSPPQPMNSPPQPMNNPPQPMNNPPPPPHMNRPPPRMNNPPPPPMNSPPQPMNSPPQPMNNPPQPMNNPPPPPHMNRPPPPMNIPPPPPPPMNNPPSMNNPLLLPPPVNNVNLERQTLLEPNDIEMVPDFQLGSQDSYSMTMPIDEAESPRRSPRKHPASVCEDTMDDKQRLVPRYNVFIGKTSLRKACSLAKKAAKPGYTLTMKLMPYIFTDEEMANSRGQGLQPRKPGDVRLVLDKTKIAAIKEFTIGYNKKNGLGVPTDSEMNAAITERVSYSRKLVQKKLKN